MTCECYLVSIKPLVEQKRHLQVVFATAKAKKPRLELPNIVEALTIHTIIMEDQGCLHQEVTDDIEPVLHEDKHRSRTMRVR